MSKKTIKYNRKNIPMGLSKTGSDYMRERYDIMREIGKRENFNLSDYPYSLMQDNVVPSSSSIEIRGRKAKMAWVPEINNPDKKAVILTVGNIHTLAYVHIEDWRILYEFFKEAKTIATYKVTYNKKTGKKTYDKLKTLEGVKELFKKGKNLYFGQKLVINK